MRQNSPVVQYYTEDYITAALELLRESMLNYLTNWDVLYFLSGHDDMLMFTSMLIIAAKTTDGKGKFKFCPEILHDHLEGQVTLREVEEFVKKLLEFELGGSPILAKVEKGSGKTDFYSFYPAIITEVPFSDEGDF